MIDPVKRLRELEASLEKAKLEKANLEGKKETIMKELEEVFEITSIEDAEELLHDYLEEMDNLTKKINTHIGTITKLLE